MGLVLAAIIIFVLFFVWTSVFSLLPQSVTIDTQSSETFNTLVKNLNKLENKDEVIINLKEDYSLVLTNPEAFNREDNQFLVCKTYSCVCLCQDENCEKVLCNGIVGDKKFKEETLTISNRIKTLSLISTKNVIEIKPKS